jgi:probable phosphoglycerate mutase
MRLLLLARHGQSVLNVRGTVNGDPRLDLGLSEVGRDEARGLEQQLAGVAIDLCVTSRFPRARESARLALGARAGSLPAEVDEALDDVRIGELEGETIDAYRAWKRGRTRADRFPGGESLDEAARRYADAFERLLGRDEKTVLCVCHEIPVRYVVNAAAGSGTLDGPLHDVRNATPYLLDAAALTRAVARIRELGAATGPDS